MSNTRTIGFILCLTLLLTAACSSLTADTQGGSDGTPSSGEDPNSQLAVVQAEEMAPRVYEERRRELPGGRLESRTGPVYQAEPVDSVFVGYGEVIVELLLPPGAEEAHLRDALELYPSTANLRWLRTGLIQVRWPGSVYVGVEPVDQAKVEQTYSLRLRPRSRIGPDLLVGGALQLTVRREAAPLYSIVEVGNDAIRTPYERPRYGYDLTQKEHTFEVNFTRSMDMQSVREALEQQLGCLGLTTFEIVDANTARYSVMTEPRKSCSIDPEGARDDEGRIVWFGMPLRYTIVPPVEVMQTIATRGDMDNTLDSQTMIDPGRPVVGVLDDGKRVVALEAGYDDDVTGPASYLPWLYTVDDSGNVQEATDLSSDLGFVLEALPVSDNSLLFRRAHDVVLYDADTGEQSVLYEAPDRHRVFGMALGLTTNRLGILVAPVKDVSNRPLHVAVVQLDDPDSPDLFFEEVGYLSAEDWMYAEPVALAWGPNEQQLHFVSYIREEFRLTSVDATLGTRNVNWDLPQLARFPLLGLSEPAALVALGLEGQPFIVRPEATGVAPLLSVAVERVSSIATNGSVVAVDTGDKTLLVEPGEAGHVELPARLVGWSKPGQTLWMYRWRPPH